MMDTKTTTIQERAQWHLANFERGDRDSEASDGKIWQVKDRLDHVETVALALAAHTDPDGDLMLPDDWRYEYIVDALNLITESTELPEYGEDDWNDIAYGIEGEIYNDKLSAWLASHLYRAAYTDEACDGIDGGHDTFTRLTLGNAYEQRFVFESVLAFIQNEITS